MWRWTPCLMNAAQNNRVSTMASKGLCITNVTHGAAGEVQITKVRAAGAYLRFSTSSGVHLVLRFGSFAWGTCLACFAGAGGGTSLSSEISSSVNVTLSPLDPGTPFTILLPLSTAFRFLRATA